MRTARLIVLALAAVHAGISAAEITVTVTQILTEKEITFRACALETTWELIPAATPSAPTSILSSGWPSDQPSSQNSGTLPPQTTTSTLQPSPVPLVPDTQGHAYQLLGCFPQAWASTTPPDGPDYNTLSPELCAAACTGRRYFGVQEGSLCLCSDKGPSSPAVNETLCSSACSGDATEACGSAGYVQIYKLTSNATASEPTSVVGLTQTTPFTLTTASTASGAQDITVFGSTSSLNFPFIASTLPATLATSSSLVSVTNSSAAATSAVPTTSARPICNGIFTDQSGGLSKIYCNADWIGDSFSTLRLGDFSACIEACESTKGRCLAAVWNNQTQRLSGFGTCDLKQMSMTLRRKRDGMLVYKLGSYVAYMMSNKDSPTPDKPMRPMSSTLGTLSSTLALLNATLSVSAAPQSQTSTTTLLPTFLSAPLTSSPASQLGQVSSTTSLLNVSSQASASIFSANGSSATQTSQSSSSALAFTTATSQELSPSRASPLFVPTATQPASFLSASMPSRTSLTTQVGQTSVTASLAGTGTPAGSPFFSSFLGSKAPTPQSTALLNQTSAIYSSGLVIPPSTSRSAGSASSSTTSAEILASQISSTTISSGTVTAQGSLMSSLSTPIQYSVTTRTNQTSQALSSPGSTTGLLVQGTSSTVSSTGSQGSQLSYLPSSVSTIIAPSSSDRNITSPSYQPPTTPLSSANPAPSSTAISITGQATPTLSSIQALTTSDVASTSPTTFAAPSATSATISGGQTSSTTFQPANSTAATSLNNFSTSQVVTMAVPGTMSGSPVSSLGPGISGTSVITATSSATMSPDSLSGANTSSTYSPTTSGTSAFAWTTIVTSSQLPSMMGTLTAPFSAALSGASTTPVFSATIGNTSTSDSNGTDGSSSTSFPLESASSLPTTSVFSTSAILQNFTASQTPSWTTLITSTPSTDVMSSTPLFSTIPLVPTSAEDRSLSTFPTSSVTSSSNASSTTSSSGPTSLSTIAPRLSNAILLGNNEDEAEYGLELPFTLSLYTQSDTNMTVTTNGVFSIMDPSQVQETATDGGPTPPSLPTWTLVPGTAVPWWHYMWSDTTPGLGVYWQLDRGGTFLSVEWMLYDSNNTLTNFILTYDQAKPGNVTFYYFTSGDRGETSTVGVQGLDLSNEWQAVTFESCQPNSIQAGMVINFATDPDTTSTGTSRDSTFDLNCFPPGSFPAGVCSSPAT